MAQLSLAWMLTKDVVSAPVIGANRPERLQDAIGTLFFPRSRLGGD
jgi:aryl-alcohol dehydrogenase-like predicted oxidoreductase